MVFNGDSDGQDLCTLADELAGSNDTSFPLAKKALYANLGSRKIRAAIWRVFGGWIHDDKSQTDLPEATTDLESGQQFYAMPDSAQELLSVEWKDANGTWIKLDPITLQSIGDRGVAEQEFMKTSGNPLYYRPVANGFKIYPASDSDRDDALRINTARDIVAFASTSTTATPGFVSSFHEAVAIYMAYMHAKKNTLATMPGLRDDWITALAEIEAHYQTRYRELFPPKMKKRAAAVQQYV